MNESDPELPPEVIEEALNAALNGDPTKFDKLIDPTGEDPIQICEALLEARKMIAAQDDSK